ncbi:MAG: hypothetical protein JWN48_3997 [Myxococcaceae bacterium]|nr:hypothetical protein [Myxococcaceae bacterium]
MPALLIPIHHLDNVGKDFSFALDESWLREAFAQSDVSGDASRVGSVEVHAQRNGNEILVHGKAEGRLITECVRCLKPLSVDVECAIAALYAPTATRPRHNDDDEEDLEIDPDAPDREFYTGETVFIDDLVRDYLLLELPMQPRCEPECESLGATTSGSPWNGDGSHDSDGVTIDPRLLPLMKLAKGEPEKE